MDKKNISFRWNFRRAFLYLSRKKSKSIVLFAILFVLFTLVMTGIAISNAVDENAAELRRILGGYFKLVYNTDYQVERTSITDQLVDHIDEIDGIKSHNRMLVQYVMMPDLVLEPGLFTNTGDEKSHLARFLGNTDSSLHEYFFLRSFTLTQGRHIEAQDSKKAMVSKTLAELNNLTIGDSLRGKLWRQEKEEETQISSIDEKEYFWEIVGIFETSENQSSAILPAECDILDNFIFVDEGSLMALQENLSEEAHGKYQSAAFFLEDPEKSNDVIGSIYEIDGVNWDSLEIKVNTKTYDDSAKPLLKLREYIYMFLLVIIVLSILLLSLILTMWTRDRLHEIGILLSIGIHKRSILIQHMTEVLAIVFASLVLSFPAASLISDSAGTSMMAQILSQEDSTQKTYLDTVVNSVDLSATEGVNEIFAMVGIKEFFFVALYGIAVGIVATGISSVKMLRLKPTDILSSTN